VPPVVFICYWEVHTKRPSVTFSTVSNLPSALSPGMSRILSIPELLRMIFEFSGREENARYAVVCQQWSAIALDVLWDEVYDLRALFNALAPVQRRTTGSGKTCYVNAR
jgi:hypothetical protein